MASQPSVSNSVKSVISSPGSGSPLNDSVRSRIEPLLDADLSGVRVHSDPSAQEASQSINARAFTHQNNIFLGKGQSVSDVQLMAHEAAHVVQQKTNIFKPVIQKQSVCRDWVSEANHLTTTELENEINYMRDVLLYTYGNIEDKENIEKGLLIFESSLAQRQELRIGFSEYINTIRKENKNEDLKVLFLKGFAISFSTELPPGELKNFLDEMIVHKNEFDLGYLAGLPEGLLDGLTSLVEGIAMLVEMAAKAIYYISPVGLSITTGQELYEMASNPSAYVEKWNKRYLRLKAIEQALAEFAIEFIQDPTIVMQMSSDLGLALGELAGQEFTSEFLRISPFDKGYKVGNIAGMILFEVLLEIILAVATEGIGNVLRGVVAVGQGARHGGRVARIIHKMLVKSPALRKLLRAVSGIEDVTDLVRAGERGSDVAESLVDTSKGMKKVKPKSRVHVEGEFREFTPTSEVTTVKGPLKKLESPPTRSEKTVFTGEGDLPHTVQNEFVTANDIGSSRAEYGEGIGGIGDTGRPTNFDKFTGRANTTHASGVLFDEKGFPIFDSLYDFTIPSEMSGLGTPDDTQFIVATAKLRQAIWKNPALKSKFSPKQLAAIDAVEPKIPGYVWHHHQDGVRLQLVDEDKHKLAHIGGRAMEGGRYRRGKTNP